MAGDFQQQFFGMLMSSQYWPAARMRAYQRGQLEALVRHARAHTRFYRDRLAPLFKPNGSIDWDRWNDIPIVGRADIMADPDAFLADALPPGHGPTGEIKTSGSTGRRLTVRYTRLTAMATQAARWRADLWHGVDWSKALYICHGEYPDQAEWPTGEALGPWGPPWDARARVGHSFRLHKQVPNEKQVDFMRQKGIAYAALPGPKRGAWFSARGGKARNPAHAGCRDDQRWAGRRGGSRGLPSCLRHRHP